MSAGFARGRHTAENPGKLWPAGSHQWTGSRMPITLHILYHAHTGWQGGPGWKRTRTAFLASPTHEARRAGHMRISNPAMPPRVSYISTVRSSLFSFALRLLLLCFLLCLRERGPHRFPRQDVGQRPVQKERLGTRIGGGRPVQLSILQGSAVRLCGLGPNLVGKTS